MRIPLQFRPCKAEQGLSLIELMIAMVILAVGLSSLTILFMYATASNARNNKDTSATLLAKTVLEQISAQHPNSSAPILLTDCAGNQFTIATAGGAAPNGVGATLLQDSASFQYGGIDQTQSYSAVPNGYAMVYTDCGTNGKQITYDVRWNVMTISANTTRLITVSARQSGITNTQLGGRFFAIPVSLRGIGGP